MVLTRQKKLGSVVYEMIQVPQAIGVKFEVLVDPGSYIPTHWHQAIEILYVQEGELEVGVENRTVPMVAGDCLVINANKMHYTKCTQGNKAILLQIPIEFLATYLPEVQQLVFVCSPDRVLPSDKSRLNKVKETLYKMEHTYKDRQAGYLLAFNSLLFNLLEQLVEGFSVKVFPSEFSSKGKDLDRLNQVLEYTGLYYNRPIPLKEIAGVACFQTGYFCRFFKKHMGITFLAYQNELRLSYIYQDLLASEDRVGDILERHGFTNYQLFRRMFQEHFNATPSQIRKKG